MSTLAMRRSAPTSSISSSFAPDATPTDHLIAASGIRPSDRVLIFGHDILDHLALLARRGVTAAMGVCAGYPYHPHEPVDAVWFTDVSDIDDEVTHLVGALGHPRLITVELTVFAQSGALRRLLQRLRLMGLTQTRPYKVAGRLIITAWRPDRPRNSDRV